ncbi:conserved hypothetical protein [Yersinia pestis biovar Orientalis str. F1991016]|nr:conserved hypothetical protein [Yersinia pestis biovar Orientalis str. F1991016]
MGRWWRYKWITFHPSLTDRQGSKASAPRMARLEPTWMYLRRLYDLPVLSVAGTLSITSCEPKD